MAESGAARSALRIEQLLTALKGVRRARVQAEGDDLKVRALVVPEKPTAEAISQIKFVIKEETGRDINDAAVEILRIGDDRGSRGRRRKLSSIATERSGERFKARVVLELAGDVLIGESDSPSERGFEYRSVAKATLESLSELLREIIDLESVELFDVGAGRLAVVTLKKRTETLVGSALVRLDDHDAIARATLDALNRSLLEREGFGVLGAVG
ncbi:MAG: hypothetical protein M3280_01030 [Actinomycetota bacterium]|nr:hypothetical protein [Actinomycetota bacterium]